MRPAAGTHAVPLDRRAQPRPVERTIPPTALAARVTGTTVAPDGGGLLS
jgi:hypothetical protein